METYELMHICQQVPELRHCVKGVVAADAWVPLEPGEAIISNTDPASLPGQHWVALYRSSDSILHFFCSYAGFPQTYNNMWMPFIEEYYDRVCVSTTRVQAFNSNTCGLHAMKAIMCNFYNNAIPAYTRNYTYNDSMFVSYFKPYMPKSKNVCTLIPCNQTCVPYYSIK
jgi:hypothetical protein